ncbi:hypothetical protein HYV85_03605 [Candidatus Woesearchaeota archaeon]|nr:hypothetical protein [Candidatus Woesearchaeota archaeon]
MLQEVEIKKKLNSLESELTSLKSMVLKLSQAKAQDKVVRLEGSLKGLSITENDIESAKKSLFKVDAA